MHFKDAKSILSARNGMNIFRGCTHGCIYCDSRSLCYNFEHAFTDIEVKRNAPELLEQALRKKRKRCMISTGSMCDPYIPEELTLRYTRKCLEIIDEYGFGLSILTKSDRILRDIDILQSINKKAKCVVEMTLTTFDEDLCAIVEPNVCTTKRRFEALCEMREQGIPTVVWLSPFLPRINDTLENVSGLLEYCKAAGVYGIISYGIGLTLRDGNRQYFYGKLDEFFPGLRKYYEDTYGLSYELQSENNAQIMKYLRDFCKTNGIESDARKVFSFLSELKPESKQLSLF